MNQKLSTFSVLRLVESGEKTCIEETLVTINGKVQNHLPLYTLGQNFVEEVGTGQENLTFVPQAGKCD